MSIAYLFIDRDGTLIEEPESDKQVDRLDKLKFEPNVIPALLALSRAGYVPVIVTNQDGLGTECFPQKDFDEPHKAMLTLFASQGIHFDNVLICPHLPEANRACRKPGLALVKEYLQSKKIDFSRSRVIGDRKSDMQLADNMGLDGILYDRETMGWDRISHRLVNEPRVADVCRQTRETSISATVDLDPAETKPANCIATGIAFFDHMLDQIATHAGFHLELECKGDTEVDDHHTIEDCALVLGEALKKALGHKAGTGRFGFVLPMDESQAHCALDLSGRPFLLFDGHFSRERAGDMSTEMVPHFFRSFSDALRCTLHLSVSGSNTHHMVESLFKSLGRSLREAIKRDGYGVPSSKGRL